MPNFLKEINHNNSANDWKITCCLFAPYAPEENPVEAIWLQVKTFLRRFDRLAKKFKVVKRVLQFFIALRLLSTTNATLGGNANPAANSLAFASSVHTIASRSLECKYKRFVVANRL